MVKPFTQDIKEVRDFMKTFRAGNNASMVDPPEDIQGALKLMLMQDWTEEAIKRCVLICDAPCHGDQYKKLEYYENFPGGTPFGFSIGDLMKEMKTKNISF